MSDLIFDIAVTAATSAAIQEFIKLNSELDATKRALTTLLGSEEAASKELEKISTLADRTGQNTLGLAKQFTSLAAAAKGTALDQAGVQRTLTLHDGRQFTVVPRTDNGSALAMFPVPIVDEIGPADPDGSWRYVVNEIRFLILAVL